MACATASYLRYFLRYESWRSTIIEQCDRITLHLADNPTLKSYLDQAVIDAYKLAQSLIVRETPLDYPDLPSDCPYTVSQILDPIDRIFKQKRGAKRPFLLSS